MRIKLPDHYSGVPSGGRMIYPGEYDTDDMRLFGLADYLVRTGHAVTVSVINEEDAAKLPDAEIAKVSDIEARTMASLKDEAIWRGLSFSSRVTKAELITLIESSVGVVDDAEANQI